jgi:hypothetical protein
MAHRIRIGRGRRRACGVAALGYPSGMANADPVKRVKRAVTALQAVKDPLDRLEAVRWARGEIEAIEVESVAAAREAGATWSDIGSLYGVTRQGAQQRFSAAVADSRGRRTGTYQRPQTSADTSAHRRL